MLNHRLRSEVCQQVPPPLFHQNTVGRWLGLDKFLNLSELYLFRWDEERGFVALLALYNRDANMLFSSLEVTENLNEFGELVCGVRERVERSPDRPVQIAWDGYRFTGSASGVVDVTHYSTN